MLKDFSCTLSPNKQTKKEEHNEPGCHGQCTWAGKSRSQGVDEIGCESHVPWHRRGGRRRRACWCLCGHSNRVAVAVGGGGNRGRTADETLLGLGLGFDRRCCCCWWRWFFTIEFDFENFFFLRGRFFSFVTPFCVPVMVKES